jgi:TonB family protein
MTIKRPVVGWVFAAAAAGAGLPAHPAEAQDWSLVTYELSDLESALRGVRVREAVARASRLDSAALPSLLSAAATADTAALNQSAVWPALVWGMLERWGDAGFAAALAQSPSPSRSAVLRALDRAAGTVYLRRYPLTWASGPHDERLMPDLAVRPLDEAPESGRVYLAREVMPPRLSPGTCDQFDYPPLLRERGISGRATVEYIVNADGRVDARSLRVLASSHRDFADVTRRTVTNCRFVPGGLAGVAVRVWVRQTVRFIPNYVETRNATGQRRNTSLGRLQPLAESLGVDWAYSVARAMDGDTAHLAGLLRFAALLDRRIPAAAALGPVMALVRDGAGDRKFAAALAALPPAARLAASEALSAMPRSGGSERTDEVMAAALRDTLAAAIRVAVHDEDEADIRPSLIAGSCRAPAYPAELRSQGVEGRVVISIVVAPDGRPEQSSAEVVSASDSAFVEPAVTTALSCRYRPGVVDGLPVKVRTRVPVAFSISR